MIQPNEALMLCLFFLSFFHGVFTILIGIAIWLVCFRQQRKGRKNSIGLAIVVFQYCLSTAHFFMAFYQDVLLLGGGNPGPFRDIQYYGKMAFSQVATEMFSGLLADVLLTWRTYVIYGRDKRVLVLPVILILATFVSTYGYVGASIEGLSHLPTPDLQGIFDQSRMHPLSTWNIICMVMSVTTNVVLTVMTATKLLLHHRTMKNIHGFSSLIFESAVIIESGLLYTLAWVAYLVLFLIKSNADIVAMDCVGQLAGIVPTLIIVTVAAGLSPVQTNSYRRPPPRFSTNNQNSNSNSRRGAGIGGGGGGGMGDDGYDGDSNADMEIHFSPNMNMSMNGSKSMGMGFSVSLSEERVESSPHTNEVKVGARLSEDGDGDVKKDPAYLAV